MQMLKSKAFTLVEIIIAIAIASAVGLLIIIFLQNATKGYYQSHLKFIADSEAQLLIEYCKRDLSTSCKIETDDDYITKPMLKVTKQGDGGIWEFFKFDRFENGKPKAVKVRYIYDADSAIFKREVGGKVVRVWNGITYFLVKYYGLMPHHRYFYQINLEVTVGEDGITKKSERFRIVTSVESKYENNLVSFAGWLKNPSSQISE